MSWAASGAKLALGLLGGGGVSISSSVSVVAKDALLEGCADERGDLACGDVAALLDARRRRDDDVRCNMSNLHIIYSACFLLLFGSVLINSPKPETRKQEVSGLI